MCDTGCGSPSCTRAARRTVVRTRHGAVGARAQTQGRRHTPDPRDTPHVRAAVRVTRPRGRVRCRVRAGLPLPSPTGPPSTAQLASQPHDRYVESYQGSIVEITVVHPHTNPALPCWGRARSSHARAAVERPRGRPASPQHVRIAKHCRHGTRPPRNTAPASMQRHASLAAAPLARCCPHQHGMHVCTARARARCAIIWHNGATHTITQPHSCGATRGPPRYRLPHAPSRPPRRHARRRRRRLPQPPISRRCTVAAHTPPQTYE